MKTTNKPRTPRVLVVEDEALIALLIADSLERGGFQVVGPATSVAKALALLKHEECEVAVLDIRLGDESAEPIALALLARGTPFVTLSGYAPNQRASVFAGAPRLVKPVQPDVLVGELRRCLASRI